MKHYSFLLSKTLKIGAPLLWSGWKRSFFMLIFACSLFVGCKKDDPIPPTIVNGQVLEHGTNKPLEGVQVVLIEVTSTGILGSQSYYPVDTVLTDKDGKYSYTNFSDRPNVYYTLAFYKALYYEVSRFSGEELFVRTNETANPITKMFPFAWLKIRVINDKPFDNNDEIKIGGPWEAGGLDDRYYGEDINISFTKKVRGGQKIAIKWFVYKNNSSKSNIDSVYISPHDTTYYQIKY